MKPRRPDGPIDIERDILPYLALDDAGCLIWPYAVTTEGRGLVSTLPRGKTLKVHRLVFEHFNGPVPPGLQVNHTCGRGHLACVDPRHLYAGTQKQNMEDAKRHGVRLGRPPKN